MPHRPHKSRRRTAIIAGLFVSAVAVAIAVGVYRRCCGTPKRFAVVQRGVLYRSAQPRTRQIDHLIEKIHLRTDLIVRSGSSRHVPDEVAHARSRGLNVIHIPIDSRKPIPDDQVQAFFRCVDNPANRPVLIHCSAGRHRTGYLCALYRIERQGWTKERALEEMLSFGFDTQSQAEVLKQLRNYKPGRWKPAGTRIGAPKNRGTPTQP